ncbi:MAG: hypothetical protein J5865_07940, partial [Lachnospiraceae bacterium]|nr:hypothetical protein [Lachnospiraceae bacterium]
FGIKVFPKKEKEPKEKKSKKGKMDAGEDFEEAEVLEVITAEGPKEDAKPEAEGEKEPEGGQPEGTGTAADSTGTGPAEKAEAPQPAEQAESAKPAASDKDEDFDEDFFFQDVSDYKEEPEETEEPEKEKKTLSEKIEGIRQKGEDLADKLEDVKAKIDKVLDFVQDNTTQEEFSLILKRLGKALKHYIPKKFEGYARVGLSDPATTGKILMYWYSLIYPRVSDTFRLMGDFDEEVIEGDVHVKGRLRLNHIVWFGIKMLLDKRFRKLLKRGKKLAKELKGSAIEDDEDDDDKDDKKHKDDKDGTIKEEE